jgi:hypothetical protein
MEKKMIDVSILKAPLSARRPILNGSTSVDKIELHAVTLHAGEKCEVIMTSPDDEQLVYIVVRGNLYLAAHRDLEGATTAP